MDTMQKLEYLRERIKEEMDNYMSTLSFDVLDLPICDKARTEKTILKENSKVAKPGKIDI